MFFLYPGKRVKNEHIQSKLRKGRIDQFGAEIIGNTQRNN